MVGSRQSVPSWISAATTRVDFEGNVSSMTSSSSEQHHYEKALPDFNLGFGERAFSAAGAAAISAILVNPLDIAKVFFSSSVCDWFYIGWDNSPYKNLWFKIYGPCLSLLCLNSETDIVLLAHFIWYQFLLYLIILYSWKEWNKLYNDIVQYF